MREITENKLVVRNARPDELDAVEALVREAHKEYKGNLSEEAWKAYLDDVADVRSRCGMAEIVVATVNNGVVGAVTFYPDPSRVPHEVWPDGWAAIRVLAVDADFRDSDVAEQLVKECLRRCRERGCTTIGLHTTEREKASRDKYEHIGFEPAPAYEVKPVRGVTVAAYRFDFE